jgi:xanthine dehydrogenase iron-sulfur cluster and FAD-binding subunit A
MGFDFLRYLSECGECGSEVVSEAAFLSATCRAQDRSKGFYHKVRERLAWDHAIVAVATIVESSSGAVRDARVVMGGVAPIPWRAGKAEELLRGKAISEANAKRAGEIALEGAKSLKDNSDKIRIAQDLIQRGLLASSKSVYRASGNSQNRRISHPLSLRLTASR